MMSFGEMKFEHEEIVQIDLPDDFSFDLHELSEIDLQEQEQALEEAKMNWGLVY